MIMNFKLASLNVKKIIFNKNGTDSSAISIVPYSVHVYKNYHSHLINEDAMGQKV